jgi:hypothetical protein
MPDLARSDGCGTGGAAENASSARETWIDGSPSVLVLQPVAATVAAWSSPNEDVVP